MKSSGRERCLFAILAVIIAFPYLGRAQTTTGGIRGTIQDESGALIPGVTLTVTNKSTGVSRQVTADDTGSYLVSNLAAGTYAVKAEVSSFQTQVQEVTVLTGSHSNADFNLKVGVATEIMQITSSTAQVNLTEYKIDGVVTREQIENLPLNGRSFLSLAALEPGVAVEYTPNSGPGGPNNYFRVSIAGAPQAMTRISVDGASVLDRVTGGTAQNFSQETVEEFQLSSFNFDLSTGGTATGAVNIVSRTGSNDLHGSGFYFFRDHNMAAFPGFARPCDPRAVSPGCEDPQVRARLEDPFFARRQSGFDVGGPLRKDRLFWFTNFEYTNQVGARAISFSNPLFAGYNHIGQQPFIGKLWNVRTDYKLTDKHNSFLRFSMDTNDNLSGGANLESTWIASRNYAAQALMGLTSVLTPRTVNEFRYSYLYYSNQLVPPDETQCTEPLYCFDLNGPRIGGFGMTLGNDPNVTQHRILRTYQMSDNFTWQKGMHRIRFGGNWEHGYGHGSWARTFQGSFNLFSPAAVLNQSPELYATLPETLRSTSAGIPTFEDILKLPVSGAISMGVGDARTPAAYNFDKASRTNFYRLYIQDAWRLHSRFTLNYGLAWSFEDNLVNHDLDKPEYLRPVFGSNLKPTRQDYNNFDPALGFAWSVDKQNKTVIRAGSGLYHSATNTNYTRLPERAFIGPAGNGLNVNTSSGLPNPYFGQPGQPATLNFTVPTTTNGKDILNLLPSIRSQFAATGYDGKDLSIRGVDLTKQAVGTNAEGIFDSDLTTSYTFHVTAGVQREVARNLILSADFVMRRGIHFGGADTFYQVDVNRFNRASKDQAVNPTTGAVTYVRNPVIPICTAAQASIPKFPCSTGQILQYRSALNSRYRGLLVKLDKRFSNDFQFTTSYAWSRYVTWNGIINYENLDESYGINSGDVPHRLVFSAIWNLPGVTSGASWLRNLVNGWQISAISDMRSSTPGNPNIGIDMDGDGTSTFILPGLNWNGFGRGAGPDEVRRAVAEYNAAYPTPDVTATFRKRTPQNQVIPVIYLPETFSEGDTFFSTDLRLTRTFRIRERAKISLLVEGFNLLNTANLTGYSNSLNSLVAPGQVQQADFGQPTNRVNQIFGTGGPRAFQVGARLSW